MLDEPTNDLDVETLRALEEAMTTFAGTALIISHDRWFLDRIATHIIAFEGTVMLSGSRATTATMRRIAKTYGRRRTNSSAIQTHSSVDGYSVDTTSSAAARVLTPCTVMLPIRSLGRLANGTMACLNPVSMLHASAPGRWLLGAVRRLAPARQIQ
ncbi:MAG: hypothetical protein CM15mP120_05640 [Pseudomonadota bacterium]|nr:MAG: hypothetical protein CM15mP120_05640 [Pseudomonadota bacterium]